MRYAEYCQQVEHLPFPLEELEPRLKSRPLKKWAWIIHDKDTYEDGTPRPAHIHVALAFNTDQAAESIAKWFDDKPERIERCKSATHPWETLEGYLTHQTDGADGKYQYDPSEVHTSGYDYAEALAKNREEIEASRNRRKSHPLQAQLLDICQGKITRYRLGEHIDPMDRIKHERAIETAFKIQDEYKARKTERDMQVIYIYGKSGTGKTTLAKFTAKRLGFDSFITGASNDPLQGYLGQECIIFDDIRGSDWKMNDLLKMLDNNTPTLGKSRYANKLLSDCKLMILTSIDSLEDLYRGIKQSDNVEPIEQLKRRCTTVIHVFPTRIETSVYDPSIRDYSEPVPAPNPTPTLHQIKQDTTLRDFITAMATEAAKSAPKEVADTLAAFAQ